MALYVENRQLVSAEAGEVVVYFRPWDATPRPRGRAARSGLLSTSRKRFVPRILPVEVGGSVYFPNADPILHNAFSTSPGNSFDTGVQAAGEGHSHSFPHAGLVKVYCNVHRSMFAFILVLDTPYFTRPDKNGGFVLEELPDGPGELVAFHDRAPPWKAMVTPGQDEILVRMDLAKTKVPPHFNKFGRPYAKTAAGDY